MLVASVFTKYRRSRFNFCSSSSNLLKMKFSNVVIFLPYLMDIVEFSDSFVIYVSSSPILLRRARSMYCRQKDSILNQNLTSNEKLYQDIICRGEDGFTETTVNKNKITYVTVKFQPIFFEIMEQEEMIRVAGYIQLSWVDERLKWAPSKYGSLTEFKTDRYDIWYPHITYYEMGSAYRFLDEMDKHSFEDVVIKSNGSVSLHSVSNLYGPCEYDTTSWPFEEWKCVFTLCKTSDEENLVQINPFTPRQNIDTSALEKSKVWKIVSTPQFSVSGKTSEYLEISITVQRNVSHYQNVFIFPGIGLLILTLISFWLTNWIYCRMILNMLTTLVQLTFLERMLTMMNGKGSTPVVLYNFYLDTMFTSFIGILFAVVNAKLITRSSDPPQYLTEIIGIVAVLPVIGPVFSYLVFEDTNSTSAVEDDEAALVTGKKMKESQKWRLISNFTDKCAFIVLVLYFSVVYLL